MMSKNIILCAIAIFFAALISAGCQEREKARVEKEAIPVRVIKVELKSIKNTLDYVDDIKAQDEAVIYPKVSGKIIEKIKEEGDKVNKGDVVAY
ncbi:MAG: efflux RND transporter periplasmic adaptor subunit, partial [Candidatus Omnitrophica bacterium]|nr:efflux RND transporter periplasmic adaptor subunit [Candidatus Omnitrophota bacterium]